MATMVVIALRQIQDGGGRVLRQEFKMVNANASADFKMTMASHALVHLQGGGRARASA